MSTLYTMRAYKTSSPQKYVYWTSVDSPDLTGQYSGYSPSELSGIVVDYSVQQPFMPPSPSLPGMSASGDLSGTYPSPSVTGLLGRPIHNENLQDGYTLTYRLLTQTDGYWYPSPGGSGGSITIGGINTQVQFNDLGSLGGSPNFAFNKTTNVLTVPLTLKQLDNATNGAAGSTLTIQAQNATGTTSIGGQLTLASGTGTASHGAIKFQVGGVDKIVVNAGNIVIGEVNNIGNVTTYSAANIIARGTTHYIQPSNGSTDWVVTDSTKILSYLPFTFGSLIAAPKVNQVDIATNSATGNPLVIQAQNATGTTSTGGQLTLTSGTGTTAAGSVVVQTGGTARLTVSPTLTTTVNPLVIGSSTATAGDIRGASGFNIQYNVGGINRPLIQGTSGAQIVIGGFAANECGGIVNRVSTGGTIYNQIAGNNFLTINETLSTHVMPLALGTNPSTTGILRLPSGGIIKARDQANAADKHLLGFTNNILQIGTDSAYSDQVDRVDIYSSAGGNVYMGNGGLTRLALNSGGVTIYGLTDNLTFGYADAAASGKIRLPNAATIKFRNAGNTGDVQLAIVDAGNVIRIGNHEGAHVMQYSGTFGAYNGSSYDLLISPNSVTTSGNTSLGSITSSYGGGQNVTFVANAGTQPSTNPTGGVVLYTDSTENRLKTRTSDGYVMALDHPDPTINGFRLSLSGSASIPSADVSSSSTLYFIPHTSGFITLWDGSSLRLMISNQASLALSGLTTGKNYDVFAYKNGTSVSLELGAAWSTDTGRASVIVRGPGNMWVLTGAPTRRYVGTFRATGATTTTDTVLQRFIYNEYNQTRRNMLVNGANINAGGSWQYSLGTFRQANAVSAAKYEFVLGNPGFVDSRIDLSYTHSVANGAVYVAVGLDSITSTTGSLTQTMNAAAAGVAQGGAATRADMVSGYHYHSWLEQSSGATATILAASYMRGLITM